MIVIPMFPKGLWSWGKKSLLVRMKTWKGYHWHLSLWLQPYLTLAVNLPVLLTEWLGRRTLAPGGGLWALLMTCGKGKGCLRRSHQNLNTAWQSSNNKLYFGPLFFWTNVSLDFENLNGWLWACFFVFKLGQPLPTVLVPQRHKLYRGCS